MSSHRTTSATAPSRAQFAFGRLAVLPVLVGCAVALGANATPAHSAETAQWVPGRILVQPKAGLADAELAKILKPHGGKSIAKIDAIGLHIVQLPAQGSEKAIAALLARNPHLKFAEPDMLVKPAGTANDKYYANAWHLPKIGVPTAWDSSTGSNQVIAILDTGIDAAHPDLAGKLVPGWNFYNGNADTSDVHGHGTAVGGAAVALTNNTIGVAAVAPGAMLMPVRIADPNAWATWSTVAQGLTWAADNGADVANISYNGVSGSASVQSAAQYMKNKGGLVVVAAGNNGIAETIAPSSTMITVSATDSADAKTSWSSFGNFVDIAAPGINIYTTAKGGGYSVSWGTSLASPVVAGAVALIKAANPTLAPSDVERVLFSTAVDLGTAGFDTYFGNGRVNAAAATAMALTTTTMDTSAPTVAITSPSTGASVKGLVTVGVSAADDIGVAKVQLEANGTLIATDITAPYSFSWDSSSVTDGAATLRVYAYDAAGNYSSATTSVTVANTADTTAPAASIKNPVNGAKVSGTVGITASATDNVAVTKLALYIDGAQVASSTSASLSYSWNTRKAASGSHTLEVRANDAAGNSGTQIIQVTK